MPSHLCLILQLGIKLRAAGIGQLNLFLETWSFCGDRALRPNAAQVLGTLRSRSEHTIYIDFAVAILFLWQFTGGKQEGEEGEVWGEDKASGWEGKVTFKARKEWNKKVQVQPTKVSAAKTKGIDCSDLLILRMKPTSQAFVYIAAYFSFSCFLGCFTTFAWLQSPACFCQSLCSSQGTAAVLSPLGNSEGSYSFAAQPSGQPGPSAEPSKPKPSWLPLPHVARRRRVMLRKRQVRKCLFSPACSLIQWVGRLCLSRTNGRVPLFLPSCPWFTSYFSMTCPSQTVWKSNQILHLSQA